MSSIINDEQNVSTDVFQIARNEWTPVRISQSYEGQLYMFKVIINGNTVYEMENGEVAIFNDVYVRAASFNSVTNFITPTQVRMKNFGVFTHETVDEVILDSFVPSYTVEDIDCYENCSHSQAFEMYGGCNSVCGVGGLCCHTGFSDDTCPRHLAASKDVPQVQTQNHHFCLLAELQNVTCENGHC